MNVSAAESGAARVNDDSVVALWRYPVKSMMGEELNASEVTVRGLIGDRQFAVVDASTGKVAGAKNPRKWGNFFDYRAMPGSCAPRRNTTRRTSASMPRCWRRA